jgi:uncharacterized integral membrane protein
MQKILSSCAILTPVLALIFASPASAQIFSATGELPNLWSSLGLDRMLGDFSIAKILIAVLVVVCLFFTLLMVLAVLNGHTKTFAVFNAIEGVWPLPLPIIGFVLFPVTFYYSLRKIYLKN